MSKNAHAVYVVCFRGRRKKEEEKAGTVCTYTTKNHTNKKYLRSHFFKAKPLNPGKENTTC